MIEVNKALKPLTNLPISWEDHTFSIMSPLTLCQHFQKNTKVKSSDPGSLSPAYNSFPNLFPREFPFSLFLYLLSIWLIFAPLTKVSLSWISYTIVSTNSHLPLTCSFPWQVKVEWMIIVLNLWLTEWNFGEE